MYTKRALGHLSGLSGRPPHAVQLALAGGLALLMLLTWHSSGRPGLSQSPQQYVEDLNLGLDLGPLAMQYEADAWCTKEPLLSSPPTDEELRKLRVAIVIEPVCRRQEYLDNAKMAACLDEIMRHCNDLTKNGCFSGYASKVADTVCKGVLPPDDLMEEDGVTPIKWNYYQRWWQTVATQVAPELRKMGWTNLKILSDQKSPSERRMASCADVLVTSSVTFWQLYPLKHNLRPRQRLLLIEQYGAGTFMIPQDMESMMESRRVLAVLKNVVVNPAANQNGPLLEERSHLALMAQHIPNGTAYLTMKTGKPWTRQMVEKIHPLLPMSMRFAHPLQCGGGWNFVRYHGFFIKNHKRWVMAPLAEREYDVTFIGKLEYEAKAEVSGVTAHRQAAVKALAAFREKWGHKYRVYVPQGERLQYHEYIALLKKSKVVLSPWGWGEWSHKDFEILMSGCLIIKPRVDIFNIYPPIFQHNETCISVKEDFSDLEEQVLPLLQDIPRAQKMATRQQGIWRHHARSDVVAKDWDSLLLKYMNKSYSEGMYVVDVPPPMNLTDLELLQQQQQSLGPEQQAQLLVKQSQEQADQEQRMVAEAQAQQAAAVASALAGVAASPELQAQQEKELQELQRRNEQDEEEAAGLKEESYEAGEGEEEQVQAAAAAAGVAAQAAAAGEMGQATAAQLQAEQQPTAAAAGGEEEGTAADSITTARRH